MKTLLTLNKEALKCADDDEGRKDATYRMALGVYCYQGADEASGGSSDESP